MHTTRNTFKRENFNTKNTEIAFYSFKQYLSMDIHIDTYRCTTKEMEIYLKHFIFFHVPEQKKLSKKLKNQGFLGISSNVSYVRYICYVPRHWKRR